MMEVLFKVIQLDAVYTILSLNECFSMGATLPIPKGHFLYLVEAWMSQGTT